MQAITNEQIYDRWEQIPGALKEAFFSTDNGEIIWKACEDAGLSEEVIDNVLIVVGNVLLGFTHINDFINELKSIPDMDQQAVDPIIFQIDKRIFEPVKGDILKLYRIMSGEEPKMVAEAGPELAEGGSEQGTVAGNTGPIDLRLSESPIKEGSLMDQTAQIGIRKIKIEGEGESVMNVQEHSIEEPAIIHEEAALKPITQKKRALSAFGGLFGFKREATDKKEGLAVEAQISMIEGVGKKPEAMTRTEQQPVKVVHYTSAAAPEDMFGQVSQRESMSPIVKQEHDVFEPMVVNMAEHPMGAQSVAAAPQPVHEEVVQPASPAAIVMKTPQRPEAIVDGAVQKESEPRLAEIPVVDDAVDLRTLERVVNNPRPTTDNKQQ